MAEAGAGRAVGCFCVVRAGRRDAVSGEMQLLATRCKAGWPACGRTIGRLEGWYYDMGAVAVMSSG